MAKYRTEPSAARWGRKVRGQRCVGRRDWRWTSRRHHGVGLMG